MVRTLVRADPITERIRQLKVEKKAVIPAHYYQRDEVKAVADFVGDSLELSRKCLETDADVIVFAGVRFMAETAKILCPDKTVLLPSLDAGCSLAEGITAAKLRKVKAQYPDAAVVCYVNTSAAVKAESDVCCTSANYLRILDALPQKRVIFVPDRFMAANAAKQTKKEIIPWDAECVVHKKFTPDYFELIKGVLPELKLLVHIECPPSTIALADYAGSTSGIIRYVREHPKDKQFIVLTECDMLPTLQREFPDRNFSTPCTICPYMKQITPERILTSLERGIFEITLPEEIRVPAHRSLERMLELSK